MLPKTTASPWLTAALILLTVVLAAATRLATPELFLPFEQDEIVTLGSTSAGMFDNVEQLQARPKHDVKEVANGFVRPFAGRWDPNYHIPHGWLVSVSTFFTGYAEWAVRLPALGAFLLSVALLQWLLWDIGRSRVLMVLGGLAFAALPFSWQYSVSARGYSLMVLLVLMQFALLRPVIWRRFDAGWIFFGLSVLNVLAFLNIASLLIMWLAPFCLCVFLLPRPGAEEVPAGPNAALLRGKWLWDYRARWCQYAGLGLAACAMFVLCKLHNFIAAQERYGFALESRGVALGQLAKALNWLVPGWATGIALLALFCLVALPLARRWKSAPLLALVLSLFFCALYTAATKKVAWERTYGFLLAPAFLVLAEGWAAAQAARLKDAVWPRYVLQGALGLVLVLAVVEGPARARHDLAPGKSVVRAFSELGHALTAKFKAGEIPATPPPFIVKPYSWDVNAYLPSDPAVHVFKPVENQPAQFLFLMEKPYDQEGYWLRTVTWENDASKHVNLDPALLGKVDVVVQQPLRQVVRKKFVPNTNGVAIPRTPPPITHGIYLRGNGAFNRTDLVDWLSAQAPGDYREARVTLQNYGDEPTAAIFWITPEFPSNRWGDLLKSFPPARDATLWYLHDS
jgi:hypothetical protein